VHRSEIFPLVSVQGQIRPYYDIPAMSGLTMSGHPHVTTEGLKSATKRHLQSERDSA